MVLCIKYEFGIGYTSEKINWIFHVNRVGTHGGIVFFSFANFFFCSFRLPTSTRVFLSFYDINALKNVPIFIMKKKPSLLYPFTKNKHIWTSNKPCQIRYHSIIIHPTFSVSSLHHVAVFIAKWQKLLHYLRHTPTNRRTTTGTGSGPNEEASIKRFLFFSSIVELLQFNSLKYRQAFYSNDKRRKQKPEMDVPSYLS